MGSVVNRAIPASFSMFVKIRTCFNAIFKGLYMKNERGYKLDTVLYQFLETGTSDITFMGRDQELKWLAFSLYPLSFFLYSPLSMALKQVLIFTNIEKDYSEVMNLSSDLNIFKHYFFRYYSTLNPCSIFTFLTPWFILYLSINEFFAFFDFIQLSGKEMDALLIPILTKCHL